jgi:hypothetical protein
MLAPPLMHNHPPAGGGAACGGDGGHHEAALEPGTRPEAGSPHCPACAAGPAPVGLLAASPDPMPHLTVRGPAPTCLRGGVAADAAVRSARAPPIGS